MEGEEVGVVVAEAIAAVVGEAVEAVEAIPAVETGGTRTRALDTAQFRRFRSPIQGEGAVMMHAFGI